jgi:hypothetical protein
LWGGTVSDTSGVDFTAECSAAMGTAMNGEARRRALAEHSPGLGALVQLPPSPNGPGAGIWDTGLQVVGESHQVAPYVPQHKSYGPDRPVYAPDVVGGLDYAPGAILTALRAAAERVFAGQDAAAAGAAVEVVSPAAAPRRGLFGRLFGRRRSR